MPEKEKYLFMLDVDQIQSFIFNTNRLKTIIGASRLLDFVNADNHGPTFKLLKNCRDSAFQKPVDPTQAPGFIYSSGGNTKLIFNDKGNAEDFERDIRQEYARYNIPVTTHVETLPGGQLNGRTLQAAEKKMARKKYAKTHKRAPMGVPYFKICELCGKDYAEETRVDSDDTTVNICRTCLYKFDKAKKSLRLFPNYQFESETHKIAKDLMAVVVMDGNRLGDKVKAIENKEQLRQFAEITESVFQSSFDECLYEIFPNEYEYPAADGKKHFKSIRPLIMGGDDICFIVDYPRALDFVKLLSDKVCQKSLENRDLFGDGIFLSCGILFAKPNYPFNFAYQIAESLLRSAKRYSRQQNDCAAIDFHMLLSSSGDEIEKTREREYTYNGGENVLTGKPWAIADLGQVKNDLESFKKALSARSKQKYLRQVLRWGREASNVELLKLALRMGAQERAGYIDLLNRYGWKQFSSDGCWHTGLLDLVELTDIVEM